MVSFSNSSKIILPAPIAFFCFLGFVFAEFLSGWINWGDSLCVLFLKQILFLALPCLLLAYIKKAPLFGWTSWQWPEGRAILTSIFILFILEIAIMGLSAFQEVLWPFPESFKNRYHSLLQIRSVAEGIAKMGILAATPAFLEEIFFREILQNSWVAHFGKKGGLVLTALFFALAHGHFLLIHFYFILGLYFGYLKEWKGSLWLPIIAHFLNNMWTLGNG